MATTQYIGARYVPLFSDPIEWNNTRTYEPLTIVIHEGNSYTSRQYVPIGIDIDNDNYWALTGNYNAQVEQYRREVKAIDSLVNGTVVPAVNQNSENIATNAANIDANKTSIATNAANIDANKTSITALTNKVELLSVYVTPYMFGAKGDGVTDDTKAVIEALNQNIPVLFPNGTFFITGRNTIKCPYMLGCGGVVSIASNDDDVTSKYIFDGTGDMVVENMRFTTTADKTTKGISESLNDAPTSNVNVFRHTKADYLKIVNCIFDNTYITVFTNGGKTNTNMNVDITGCTFNNVYAGIFSNNSNVSFRNNYVNFSDYSNQYYHVCYPSQEGAIDYLTIENNYIIHNPLKTNYLITVFSTNTKAAIAQSIGTVTVRGNYIENCRLCYFYATAANISNFIVENNYFNINKTRNTNSYITVIDGDVTITNCTFNNTTDSQIYVFDASKNATYTLDNCTINKMRISSVYPAAANTAQTVNVNNCKLTLLDSQTIYTNMNFNNCNIINPNVGSGHATFNTLADSGCTCIVNNSNIIGTKSDTNITYVCNAETTGERLVFNNCSLDSVQSKPSGAPTLVYCSYNKTAYQNQA